MWCMPLVQEFEASVLCIVSGQPGDTVRPWRGRVEGGEGRRKREREDITADPWTKLFSRLGNAGAHRFSLP